MHRKHAVMLDKVWHLKKYKALCKSLGIHVAMPVSTPTFPHYQILICVGEHAYSLYNNSLEGTPSSVLEMNYIPHPFCEHETIVRNFCEENKITSESKGE